MFKNPDFSLSWSGTQSPTSRDAWLAELQKRNREKALKILYNTTMEQIQLKPLHRDGL